MVIYDILYLLLDIHVNLLYKFFFVILIFFYFKKIHINFLSYSYNIVVRSNNCMLEKVRLARGKKKISLTVTIDPKWIIGLDQFKKDLEILANN